MPCLFAAQRGEYSRFSRWVTEIIAAKAPLFEKVWMNFISTSPVWTFTSGSLSMDDRFKKEIIDKTNLPISFGLATNKLVAKIATDEIGNPTGIFCTTRYGTGLSCSLPVNKILAWALTFTALKEMDIKFIGDILEEVAGRNGRTPWQMGPRPVEQSTGNTFWRSTHGMKLNRSLQKTLSMKVRPMLAFIK